MPESQYTIPTKDYFGDKRQAEKVFRWSKDALAEGDAFLKRQKPYRDIREAMTILMGREEAEIPPELSRAYVNRLKRQIKEVVAVMSQINPTWFYQSNSRKYEAYETWYNRLLEDWWLSTNARMMIRKWTQYAAALGTGWIEPVWVRERGIYGRGRIDLEVHGPKAVRAIQLPHNGDIQMAYAVIISKEVPINLCRQRYPDKADQIVPDSRIDRKPGTSKALEAIRKIAGSPALARWGVGNIGKGDQEVSVPSVMVHHMYTMDNTWNASGKEITMGIPGSTTEYRVPYLGQQIPTNVPDERNAGQFLSREASYNDCLLYPLRRLTMFTETTVLYDDTSPHWHGKVPLAKLTLDQWLDDFLGYSLSKDGAGIQKDINEIVRGVVDKVNVILRPGLEYDKNRYSKAEAEKIDPRKPGLRVAANFSVGQGIRPLLDVSQQNLPRESFQTLEWLSDAQDYLTSVSDMRNLAKARQIPSDSTIDKILEVAGPVVTDMSGVMEDSLRQVGELIKPMFIQHYTAERRLMALGESGIEVETFDFDPKHVIPFEIRPTELRNRTPDFQLVREWCDGFPLRIVPMSLHEITQTQHKLMMFQWWRDGRFPIDPWTIATLFKIKNFGKPPEDADTVFKRWQFFKNLEAEIQGKMQATLQIAAQQAMMEAMGPMAVMMGGGAPGPNGPNGAPGKPGRPPTGNKPPHLEQKGDGRSTIAES